LQEVRHRQKHIEDQLVELEKEEYRFQETLKQSRRHKEMLALEAVQLEGERTDLEAELSGYQEHIDRIKEQIRKEKSAIETCTRAVEELSRDLDETGERIVELKLRLTTFGAELEGAENTLRRLNTFRDDGEKRVSQLEVTLKRIEEDKAATGARLETDQTTLRDLYAQLEALEKTLEHSEVEYQAIEGTLQQNDQALSEVRTKREETFQKIQQVELKQTERRMRRDHLEAQIHEKYRLSLAQVQEALDVEGLCVEDTQQALEHSRERIARIGEVNLTAIEEFEALNERYRLLTEQRDDLVDAIETLHRIIRRINRVSLKRFMKTFKAVNDKLQEIFPKLFEGGTARLELTNPRRPLDSGVAFMVRPPGKKLTRMSLLSGGEKALSAIALVFSIFLIKPSAFCVFDEIDAPLDHVNVHRFNQILKEIGKQSQVIMITHDRQTMEAANALFGVTMEQKGISKLISLDLSKA
ncbi:MAG: AAA family ATPase, partial [Deltaproteobacteria bacterium]|nr:AAA family ATPase [Deltaproteobacteria bacterium]